MSLILFTPKFISAAAYWCIILYPPLDELGRWRLPFVFVSFPLLSPKLSTVLAPAVCDRIMYLQRQNERRRMLKRFFLSLPTSPVPRAPNPRHPGRVMLLAVLQHFQSPPTRLWFSFYFAFIFSFMFCIFCFVSLCFSPTYCLVNVNTSKSASCEFFQDGSSIVCVRLPLAVSYFNTVFQSCVLALSCEFFQHSSISIACVFCPYHARCFLERACTSPPGRSTLLRTPETLIWCSSTLASPRSP